MKRETFPVGSFEVNSSIVETDSGKVFVVDPGAEGELIASKLDGRGLLPDAILLTHAHFDHIGAVKYLQSRYPGLKVCIGKADVPVITHPFNQYLPEYPRSEMFAGICDFSEFAAEFTVIDTPGHTPGGVCYYFEKDKLLFSGDTLFRFSVGRTDLPGADMETLLSSLCRLTQLPDDTVVVPGHGSQTDISSEKSFNPFLQCGLKGSRK